MDFNIHDNPAFIYPTLEMMQLIIKIHKTDKQDRALRNQLPGVAIQQFTNRCLVDEIVLTNDIEGVNSTRHEIREVIEKLENKRSDKRFYGLVMKYAMLSNRESITLDTCEDVRNIYNDLVLKEVTTKALSQGQFGQFPLYAFSSDGIWALQLSDAGLYSSIQPISRDISNNPDSITQLDSSIVFSTERGLKLLQGSDISLLSSSLEGANIDETFFNVNPDFSDLFIPDTDTFVETLRTCKIAYDYTNSLLHIYPKGTRKHYVYSLDTGEFSTFVGEEVKAMAQDYPSSVVQIGNALYSLEKYVSEDTRKGIAITRALTLGDPFSLKVLVDLRTLGLRKDESSKIKIAVFVSADRKNWSRLKSLRQRAFKYYRLVYFSNLYDLDTLSGTRVRFETRRDWRMR